MLISLTFWLSSVFYWEYVVHVIKVCRFLTPGCLVEMSRALKQRLVNYVG